MKGRAVGLLLATACAAPCGDAAVLGAGSHRYCWVADWARLPDGMSLGNTHGCVAVDKRGRVYVNTDSERAVVVFAPDGRFLRAFGASFRGGLHGMTLVEEGGQEFLYLAHTALHGVAKVTLEGQVLWVRGFPKEAGIYRPDGSDFLPTSVAVAPGGDFYVADGYGRSFVHQFDRDRNYVRSFGGPGTAPGKMQTPHGIFLDRRGGTPRLIVADRENHRLQRFTLDGELIDMVEGVLRRPCNVAAWRDELAVADLEGRVTILGPDHRVVAHLGANPRPLLRAENGVPVEQWRDGEFLAPHAACFDAVGNLYVIDWNRAGRVSKLRRIGEATHASQ